MTSLGLLQYSEISDNSTINSNMTELEKKKQARHNITIKKRQPLDGSGSGNSDNVNNMLKLINNSNGYENMSDDSGLVDFNPPPRAEVSSKDTHSASGQDSGASGQDSGANEQKDSAASEKKDVNVDYEKPITIANNGQMNNIQQVGPRRYPAPLDSYEGFNASPKTYANDFYKQYVPYFNQMDQGSSHAMSKDQLLEKLNYMIYLLEEQKDEKTGHVMEEIILYSFLGVFIIFVVDSFARAGKYTR